MSGLLERLREKALLELRARLSVDSVVKRLRNRRGVATLCYHTVSERLSDYPHQNSLEALERHLLFLKEHFEILPLADCLARLDARRFGQVDRPCVLLNFDDGFRDNLYQVTPLLERHEVPATLFAAVESIESSNSTYLGVAELRELTAHPLWTIGAHSLSHNSLYSYDDPDLEHQVLGSRQRLEDLLGIPITVFSYPQGKISRRVVEAVRPHFDHAFASVRRIGTGYDPHQIRRAGVAKTHDDLAQFARLLVGAPWEDGTA